MMKKTLFATLLFFVFSQLLFAQQGETFSVVDFTEKPFDTAATDERYRLVDGNGELFSIIKLVSNTAGDNMRAYSFDFGLCESRVKEIDGEVWVYVQRNAMRAKIRREGYNTVTYELPVTVQPGRVYEMTLQAMPKVVKKRYVLFKVQPADSKALVLYKADGEKDYRPFNVGQVNEEGMLSDKLVLGRYFYRITSQFYHPSEGVIELVDGQGAFTETVTLRLNLGTLTLIAEEGAEIFVDGESKGFGTWTGNFVPGFYNVECRKKNHRTNVESIEVVMGETKIHTLKPLVPITGTLDIISEPLEATISVDGAEYGKTPAVIDGIIIGAHKVTLSKSGYSTVTLDVEIKEGKVAEKSLTLKKLPANDQAAKDKKTVASKGDQASNDEKAVASKGDQVANDKKTAASNSGQVARTTTLSGGTINGHEYVDLGLSVKWATCNVGATKPEEYGGYYAWGETEEKSCYDWGTYIYCNGSENTMVKYCIEKDFSTFDNKRVLIPADDVAQQEWGDSWRMPTSAEFEELLNKCKLICTTINGVKGYKVTGSNGNSIFLPFAGYRYGAQAGTVSYGLYWTSSLNKDNSAYAYYLYFNDGGYDVSSGYRYFGQSVRPVCE